MSGWLKAIASDRGVMIVLGCAAMIRGWFYAPSMVPETNRIPALEQVAPLYVWAAIWVLIGLLLLVSSAVTPWQRYCAGIYIAANVSFCFLYLIAWALGESSRGYMSALTFATISFLALAVFVRRERVLVARLPEGGPAWIPEE